MEGGVEGRRIVEVIVDGDVEVIVEGVVGW